MHSSILVIVYFLFFYVSILVIGRLCGPTIASFIYYFSGIFFTYAIVAFIVFSSSLLVYSLEFKEKAGKIKEKKSFLSTVLKIDVLLLAFSQIINRLTRTFFTPTFTNHIIKKFNLSIETASYIQSMSFISYVLVFNNFDFIVAKLGIKLLIVVGLFINFLCSICLGPIFILPQYIFNLILL